MANTPARSVTDIPCDVVTGFLGSGKTTMLRHVLEHGLDGRRVAVLMNEIGDVGIDGRSVQVLEGVGALVELNSGCVCCTIDEFSFATAYEQVIEQVRPDLVVIETTGLADPGPLISRLEGIGASLDAIITVIDVTNFLEAARDEPVDKPRIM